MIRFYNWATDEVLFEDGLPKGIIVPNIGDEVILPNENFRRKVQARVFDYSNIEEPTLIVWVA